MKRIKKSLACLCSAGIVCSSILPLNVMPVSASDSFASTVIEEDGTICTYVESSDGSGLHRKYVYPENREDYYEETYYNENAGYNLRVICQDKDTFISTLSEQYHLEESEDGTVVVTDLSDTSYQNGLSESIWTREEACAVAKQLLRSNLAWKAFIEKEHYQEKQHGNLAYFQNVYEVYSEEPLEASDFSWAEEAISASTSKIQVTSSSSDWYIVKFSSTYYIHDWDMIRAVLKGCMEMPSVKAAYNLAIYEYSSTASITYETEATYTDPAEYMGDADEDGAVTVQDAVSVLTYYAQEAAGQTPAILQSAENSTLAEVGYLASADIDGDGKITVQDAVSILTYYAKQAAGQNPTW